KGDYSMRLKLPFRRKNTLQRFVDTVSDQLDAATGVAPDLPALSSRKGVKTGLIAAGSFAGLTAASTAISSLRHRNDRRRDGS
ncbi:MAG TPA: hypothetical protein VK510_04345, partial [Solirubrobacteraceae bacterium]|nr:hypothetical protein [Solirubrobacteraceae bacterium]